MKGDVRGLGLEENEGTGRSGGRENCVWNIMYERRIKEKRVEHCDWWKKDQLLRLTSVAYQDINLLYFPLYNVQSPNAKYQNSL